MGCVVLVVVGGWGPFARSAAAYVFSVARAAPSVVYVCNSVWWWGGAACAEGGHFACHGVDCVHCTEPRTPPPISPAHPPSTPPHTLLRPGIGDLIADDRTMMIINDIMNKAKEDVKKLIEKVQVRRRPGGQGACLVEGVGRG